MEEKDRIEKDTEFEKSDYFQEEEERRMKEELNALLRDTNPLNRDHKLTAEELQNFYSITARRKKSKKYRFREKAINIGIIGAGIILIIGIIWITLNSIQAMFSNRENQLTEEKKQTSEVLNIQIEELKREKEELATENLQLQKEIEDLKSQILEQSFTVSNESSGSNQINESNNEKNPPTNKKISYYTVQEGDTLWKISEKLYGTGQNYKDIMDYNNIKNENDLIKGMKLAIPKL